jgi:hypothetical protein
MTDGLTDLEDHSLILFCIRLRDIQVHKRISYKSKYCLSVDFGESQSHYAYGVIVKSVAFKTY